MAADALVSVGVVIAGFIILMTGWLWLDPVVSLVINALIVWGTWSLLRDSLCMAMNAVPPGIDAAKVEAFLTGQSGVATVHDLHIWGMSTTETALTAHLVMSDGYPDEGFLAELAGSVAKRFGIGHATFQVEISEASACVLAPSQVV